jgi:hypothetical protein
MIHSSLLYILLSWAHPFYVSITTINYQADRQHVEVSSRMFYDDLEKALFEANGIKINLIHPTDRSLVDSALANYLNGNLLLTVDGAPTSLRYLGYEIEEDVAWCFLESRQKIKSVKKLDIDCRLLYEQFNTQSNIFHVSVNKLRKSLKMDHPKRSGTLIFP